MDNPNISSEQVAIAAADALRNEAIQEVVLVFGNARILLTKGQRVQVIDPSDGDVVPDYPAVETSLLDDSNSWLS